MCVSARKHEKNHDLDKSVTAEFSALKLSVTSDLSASRAQR